MWLFFSQLPKGDSIRSAETAVVILLLKFSWYFMTITIIFVQEPPLTLIFCEDSLCHFASSLSFLDSTFCLEFLCPEYRTVSGVTQ